jgi:hypothetical protein
MGNRNSSATSVLVPALVRVRLKRSSDPAAVEAVLTRAIAMVDPPIVPEIVWMPVLSRPALPRPQLTFALLLDLATHNRAELENRVLKVARRAVRRALRREFASRPEVVVWLADKPGERAACLRAMIGNPRDARR